MTGAPAAPGAAVVAVILAAGAGRRLGGVAKALLTDAGGRTFLEATMAAASVVVSACVVVVGPPYGTETEHEARRLGAAVVANPDPGRGMGSSVAAGFAHVLAHHAGAAAALLWPVDHARVRGDTVARIARACGPLDVVIPTYAGRGGHPTAFGRAAWPALAGCATAPRGARSVIESIAEAEPRRIVRIEVDDSGVIADVDTPWDRR